MRLLSLLMLFVLTLHAKLYELQLFATKSSDSEGLSEMIEKGADAGLGCYAVQEMRGTQEYTFIRCDQTQNNNEILQSIENAKKAGLNYYLIKQEEDSYESTNEYLPKVTIDEPVDMIVETTDDISDSFFGTNEELIQILHNQSDISKEYLEKRKAIYLQNVAAKEKFNGLYLKGGSARNLDKNRFDYNVRLEWDIFDNGYLEAEKNMEKSLLQKEMEYEHILDSYRSANLELSLYKMYAISNFINYSFLKQQANILSNIATEAQKKYDASIITASKFYERQKASERIKHKLSYYEEIEKEPYDTRLKSLMVNIENTDLAEVDYLINRAYENNFKLKNTHSKLQRSAFQKDWKDRLKANIYVEDKKYFFLNDSDIISGVQFQVPLDFRDTKDEIIDMEMEVSELKNQALKKVIAQNIKDIYHKIKYHKSHIKALKSDIDFFQNEAKTLQLQLQYPLEKQTKDPRYLLEMLKISTSKQHQKIWQERTEILKLLLKLQNISGVQILPS